MASIFDAVPFDIWHQVAGYLDPNDYVNLSLTNRTLYGLLKDEITARKAVKVGRILRIAVISSAISIYGADMLYRLISPILWKGSLLLQR